jgi:hypothetical protein
MATRLEITHGLIAERDRLSTSADTLSVNRPTTGSKTRSKGVLFVVVSSTVPGPRTRDATKLVADTIRHEYYYDESAGVPVCLEKAIKSADRRLRSSREGAGLSPGSLGVAAAVIRNNELYLATLGSAEAYLVRSARLLMPDRGSRGGLPSDEGRTVDVWRGEINVGDGLLLVSRNMTETVGTEELKSAILTLHPQAAVEHLHHLFVAAGGEGSDGIIAVEAKEQTTRDQGRAVPVAASDSYGDLPGMMPEPVGGAMGSAMVGAQSALGDVRERFWGAMPRRRTRAHEVSPSSSHADTRRHAAMGLLALVVLVFVVGLVLMLVPRGGDVTEIRQVAGSDSALAAAQDSVERADNLISTDEALALDFYREAWAEVSRARDTGLAAGALDTLESRVIAGLDRIYDAHTPAIKHIGTPHKGADPFDLVRESAPSRGAVYIDRARGSVVRVNPKSGKKTEIIRAGDEPRTGSKAIGVPVQLTDSNSEVIVIDDKARPWRWRPSNSAGAGTLVKLTLQGSPTFRADHGDVEAYSVGSSTYRMYVAEPSLNQIMRYQQTLDRSAFSPPSPYLASQSSEVADFDQLYIDYDVYVLIDDVVRRYKLEKYDGTFALGDLPDVGDIRPDHDYQLVAGSGSGPSNNGRLYLYDALHDRIVGFNKTDGGYIGQWAPPSGGTEMDDVRGMYVIDGDIKKGKRKPDTLMWVTPSGVYRALLR